MFLFIDKKREIENLSRRVDIFNFFKLYNIN